MTLCSHCVGESGLPRSLVIYCLVQGQQTTARRPNPADDCSVQTRFAGARSCHLLALHPAAELRPCDRGGGACKAQLFILWLVLKKMPVALRESDQGDKEIRGQVSQAAPGEASEVAETGTFCMQRCYKPGWDLCPEVANEVGGDTRRLLPVASLSHTAGTLHRASHASGLDRPR